MLESPTWRANADWGEKLGYGKDELARINRDAITLMAEIRAQYETSRSPMVISGCIGPRGDGYDPGKVMSVEEAQRYHAQQVDVFAATDADMVSATTMTNVNEAAGLALAAKAARLPVAISFTLETDGRLPTGQTLKDAISEVDGLSDAAPEYFMINCAHPTHFRDIVDGKEAWTKRICGLRANASKRSHAELDNATDLDAGDPKELAALYREMCDRLPSLTLLGGCCGTDYRHIEQIAIATAAKA